MAGENLLTAAGRAALSGGGQALASKAVNKLSNPNTYKMPSTGLVGKPAKGSSYLRRVSQAGSIASQMPANLQTRVYGALMRKKSHGVSAHDIKAFNRVLSLVNRIDKHMHKHRRK